MARPQKFRHQREELSDPKVAEKLGRFVIEIEDLRAQRSKIDEMLAAAYDAIDDNGFEKKFVRKVVALRAKEDGVRRDEEEGLETYEFAIEKGVSLARTRSKPKTEEKFDPITGEFLDDEPASNGEKAVRPESAASSVGEIAASDQPETENEHPHHLKTTGGDESGTLRGSVEDRRQAASRYPESWMDGETGPVTDRRDDHLSPQSEDGVIAAVNARDGLADANGVEPSSSAPVADQPLAGGSHVTAPVFAATHQAGGSSSKTPATHPLRPNCLNPSSCAGYGSNHCHGCKVAMREGEAA